MIMARMTLLGFCFIFILMLSARADQIKPRTNPNQSKIQELRHNIEALQKQYDTLHEQMKQWMVRFKSLREQMKTVKEAMKADNDQLQALR